MIRRLVASEITEAAPRRLGPVRALDPVAPIEHDIPVEEVQAYRTGYEEGFAAGESDARRLAEQQLSELENAARERIAQIEQALAQQHEQLTTLSASLSDAWQQQLDNVQSLAFELALRGLQYAFGAQQGDRVLLQRVCAALVDDYRDKAIRLGVSPADRPLLPAQLAGVDIEEVASLAPGACCLYTARGAIESSVSVRLDAIYQAMLASLTEGAA